MVFYDIPDDCEWLIGRIKAICDNYAKYLVCISAGFTLGALFLGIKITSIGIIITVALILEAILIFSFDKKLEK
jgi:hypothetical protein